MAKTQTQLLTPSDTFVGSQQQGILSGVVGREGSFGSRVIFALQRLLKWTLKDRQSLIICMEVYSVSNYYELGCFKLTHVLFYSSGNQKSNTGLCYAKIKLLAGPCSVGSCGESIYFFCASSKDHPHSLPVGPFFLFRACNMAFLFCLFPLVPCPPTLTLCPTLSDYTGAIWIIQYQLISNLNISCNFNSDSACKAPGTRTDMMRKLQGEKKMNEGIWVDQVNCW